MMATQDGAGTAPGTVQGVRAEIDAVIETAGRVAHEGLDAGTDSVRVLAGLILQLSEQVGRLLDDSPAPATSVERSPNEADTPTEEDSSPGDAPAEPARPI